MGGDWSGQQTMMQKVVEVTPEIIVNMPQENPKAMWGTILGLIITTIIAPIVTYHFTKRSKDGK